MSEKTPQNSNVRDFIVDTFVSTIIPLAVYHFTRQYLGASEFTALIYATIYPVAESLFDLARHKQVNPVAVLVVLGILVSVGALFIGGSPRILLIRESLLTAAFGLACFVSFLLPRPFMFYFGRYFMAGNDPVKVEAFNRNWNLPKVRKTHRLITAVWGCALLGEFTVRTWMVLRLPTATVLAVAPVLFDLTILITFFWTMRYRRTVQKSIAV